jgi:hypothetical protein
MKVYDTEIQEYKNAVQYVNETTSGMNKTLNGLYDLLDELLINGEIWVKYTGKVDA